MEVAMYAMNLFTTNDAAFAMGSGALREQCQMVDQLVAWIGKLLAALGAWMLRQLRRQPRRATVLRAEPEVV
jgi:hypothetical protein